MLALLNSQNFAHHHLQGQVEALEFLPLKVGGRDHGNTNISSNDVVGLHSCLPMLQGGINDISWNRVLCFQHDNSNFQLLQW
jgi:hypothetical protein